MADKKTKLQDAARILPRSLAALFRKSGRSSSEDLPTCKNSNTKAKSLNRQSSFEDASNASHMYTQEAEDDVTGLEVRRQTLENGRPNGRWDVSASDDFRLRTQSMPASSSILKKNRRGLLQSCLMRTDSKKQFCFNEDVNVIYYEESEQTNEYTAKNLDRLKSGSDSEEYTEGSPLSPNNRYNYDTMFVQAPPVCDDEPKEFVAVDNLIVHKEVKVMPSIDPRGCRRHTLRILIQTDDDCLKDQMSVKALSGGSSIVVTLHRKQYKDTDETSLERHVEKIPLPVIVDPYKIKAHLHKTGELEINAPLKDQI